MLVFLCLSAPSFAATSIPFTINLSKAVNVTGTPRIPVDVGGVTRYATYTSGSGTSALTFTYSMVAGDVDLNGVTVSSPIDLNGGTVKDLSGNDLSPITFTPPNTTNVKVNYPSLGMDFVADADGRYTLNGTVYNDLTSFLSAAGGTFTRASIGTYFDSSGVLRTAASGVPRFDYDPVTNAAKGILIEEQRANLLTRSNEFENAAWVKINYSISPNSVTAPDGSNTADTLSGPSGYMTQGTTTFANTIYTASIYLKDAGANTVTLSYNTPDSSTASRVNVNLTTGTIISTNGNATSITSGRQFVGNGWYRVWVSSNLGSNTSGNLFIDNIGNSSGVYIWGAQLELGAFPTSYIPTSTAAVTRAADFLSVPTGSWFSAVEGTLMTNIFSVGTTGGKFFPIALLDSTNLNRTISIGNGASTGADVADTGYTTQASFSKILTSPTKIGLAYKANNFGASFDGGSTSTDSSGTVPTGFNTLRLGNNQVGGQGAAGHITRFKYYPLRVSDSQLQLMTQ